MIKLKTAAIPGFLIFSPSFKIKIRNQAHESCRIFYRVTALLTKSLKIFNAKDAKLAKGFK